MLTRTNLEWVPDGHDGWALNPVTPPFEGHSCMVQTDASGVPDRPDALVRATITVDVVVREGATKAQIEDSIAAALWAVGGVS